MDTQSFSPLHVVAALASYAVIFYVWYKCDTCCRRIGCCKKDEENEQFHERITLRPPTPIPQSHPLVRSMAMEDLSARANEPFGRSRRRKRRKMAVPDPTNPYDLSGLE